ncbi:MAG: hypothetical protein CBC94_006010, partial [Gammaproteobacteria bacterium TMED134]
IRVVIEQYFEVCQQGGCEAVLPELLYSREDAEKLRLGEEDGLVTLDGVSVEGYPDTWLLASPTNEVVFEEIVGSDAMLADAGKVAFEDLPGSGWTIWGILGAGALLSICACLGLYLTPFSDPYWVIFWSAWVAFGGAPIAVLGWAMIPDTVEYAQWRFGKRADGAIYSMASFFQKLAKTLGGAGVAAGLAVAGYVANQEQSPQALEMIHAMMSLAPMAFMALALVIEGLYRLDAQTHDDIRRQLASAQSGEEAASA